MDKKEIKICILRVGGTNCDSETKRSFDDLGVKAEIHHTNEMIRKNDLSKFDGLVLPGGFSFGDYVRAGAILAKRITSKIGKDLKNFIEEGKPILGICNGFQILVEAGLLPNLRGANGYPEAALATNLPIGFRCRWVYLKHENRGQCIFTNDIPRNKTIRIPIAHAEGRFIFSKEKEERCLNKLLENDQLVFRYCDERGICANGVYPTKPNGSFHDIAGICSPLGTIMGLMPHPERAYYGWQAPGWTSKENIPLYGDGQSIFKSMINYISRKL